MDRKNIQLIKGLARMGFLSCVLDSVYINSKGKGYGNTEIESRRRDRSGINGVRSRGVKRLSRDNRHTVSDKRVSQRVERDDQRR